MLFQDVHEGIISMIFLVQVRSSHRSIVDEKGVYGFAGEIALEDGFASGCGEAKANGVSMCDEQLTTISH